MKRLRSLWRDLRGSADRAPDAATPFWARVPFPDHPTLSVAPVDRDAVLAWVRGQIEELTAEGVDDFTADVLDARIDERVRGWDAQVRRDAEAERKRIGDALADVDGLLVGAGVDLARVRRQAGLLERRHRAWDQILTGEDVRVAATPPLAIAQDEAPVVGEPVQGAADAGVSLRDELQASVVGESGDRPGVGDPGDTNIASVINDSESLDGLRSTGDTDNSDQRSERKFGS